MNISSAQDLGAILKAARKAQGMTQQQLADMLQVTRQWVASVESGAPTARLGLAIDALAFVGVFLSTHTSNSQPIEPHPDEPELDEPELDETELDDAELDDVELDEPQPDDEQPIEREPIEPEFADSEFAQSEITETQITEVQVTDAEPIDGQPTEPIESYTVSQPPENRPIFARRTSGTPVISLRGR